MGFEWSYLISLLPEGIKPASIMLNWYLFGSAVVLLCPEHIVRDKLKTRGIALLTGPMGWLLMGVAIPLYKLANWGIKRRKRKQLTLKEGRNNEIPKSR